MVRGLPAEQDHPACIPSELMVTVAPMLEGDTYS